MDFELLKRIIEAALMAAPQPLAVAQLIDLFGEGEAPPADEIRRALMTLQQDCDGRGVELAEVASGFRYQVRTDIHPHLARLWAEKPPRYSRALLETLSLIAYRQPITRGEIEAIRGVAVNSQIVRTLEEREWIRVVGHRDVPGKPALFGTTRAFLDYFNLKSLEQLPPLSALQEITDLEPELDFDGVRARAAMPAADPAETESTECPVSSLPVVDNSDATPTPGEATVEASAASHSELQNPDSVDGVQRADALQQNLVAAERVDEERAPHDISDTLEPTGEAETSPEQIP
ncbi:MAG: SMC-Scp complex subunit ScpB [Aquimonas sp.]|nr:SMC-Scp complex subunit ScpB [Aquimonas sp.]